MLKVIEFFRFAIISKTANATFSYPLHLFGTALLVSFARNFQCIWVVHCDRKFTKAFCNALRVQSMQQ